MSFTTDTRDDSRKIRIERLSITDCDINVGTGTRFGYFFQYRKYNEIGTFIFRNNIVWSSDEVNNARLLNGSTGSGLQSRPLWRASRWKTIHGSTAREAR